MIEFMPEENKWVFRKTDVLQYLEKKKKTYSTYPELIKQIQELNPDDKGHVLVQDVRKSFARLENWEKHFMKLQSEIISMLLRSKT